MSEILNIAEIDFKEPYEPMSVIMSLIELPSYIEEGLIPIYKEMFELNPYNKPCNVLEVGYQLVAKESVVGPKVEYLVESQGLSPNIQFPEIKGCIVQQLFQYWMTMHEEGKGGVLLIYEPTTDYQNVLKVWLIENAHIGNITPARGKTQTGEDLLEKHFVEISIVGNMHFLLNTIEANNNEVYKIAMEHLNNLNSISLR